MMETWTIETNGAAIAGESRGAGEGVVFLHAGVGDRRMWRAQMAALAGHFHVAAYDQRGFGETTAEDVPYSSVGDLTAVLDRLGMQTAALVGCSLGGLVAVDFALAYPERVAALALVAPAISGAPWTEAYPPLTAARVAALDEAEEANDLSAVNEAEAVIWLDGPESLAGRVGGASRDLFLDMNGIALAHPALAQKQQPPAAYPRLAELTMPVLVVWGDLDFPQIAARCQHIVERVPGAQSAVIRGAAHLPNLEEPQLVSRLLGQFLAAP